MSVATQEFSRFRAYLWPIHRWELKKFIPLLVIYTLICFNYNILRAAKDALVVTASGAEALPFIKVWAILPMAVLLTFLFTKLSNRFHIEKVFYIMISSFICFFFLFAFVLYPYQDFIHPHRLADSLQKYLPQGFQGLIALFRNWSFTLFYVMSELWGTMIMTVLFWGFANEITSVNDAKRFYAILGLGANVSGIFSGLTSMGLSKGVLSVLGLASAHNSWEHGLKLIIGTVVFFGLVVIFLFRWYNKTILQGFFSKSSHELDSYSRPKIKMSLRKNFSYLAKSKYLICIAIIVLTYNISMNLIEIIWKDQINLLYPNPTDYNIYMAKVLTCMGILSTLMAFFVYGSLMRKQTWTFSALVTPIIVSFTGFFFFSFILFKNAGFASFTSLIGMSPLALSVFFGGAQNCLSRACKYTVFDITKEMAFIPLSAECKLKGKAAIDGIGSRLGKSGGSVFHQGLLIVFGSVAASTPYVAALLLIVVLTWIAATTSLGQQFNTLTSPTPSETPLPSEV
ncbi:MAG: NTP/NDP exchange transporter [Chlamydiae bacterium]|nr:NTP/NDP exchange transporter [Chlamydiota bacterium]